MVMEVARSLAKESDGDGDVRAILFAGASKPISHGEGCLQFYRPSLESALLFRSFQLFEQSASKGSHNSASM